MINNDTDHYFLRGGGGMGELIRAKDWSETPLGDPAEWPRSLRTMVSVMLENPFGMCIAWGGGYTQLYNDGYRPILGAAKHPRALGIGTRETFSEVWHIIGPMFEGVMQGKAVGFPDLMLPLNRSGLVEECYFDFSYSPIRKDDGGVGGVLVTVIETTERKRAQQALVESNARYADNILQAPVAMCILRGKDHVVEIANERMLDLWGKRAGHVMNRPIFEGLPEARGQGLEELADRVYATGEKFVADERPVNLPRHGKVETTYLNFVYDALREADGTISGIVAIAVEVTPQVAARVRVEESEQKVRALVENAPFPIAVYVGQDMTVELANQSIMDLWGKGSDVIGKPFREVLPELGNQLVFDQIQKVLATGESFHTRNTPLDLVVGGSPVTYYFNYSFTPLYDTAGNIYGVMNTGVDLTDLNTAKRRVEESDRRFRNTMRQAPVGITILRGPDYVVEMANDAYLKLVDKKEGMFVGRPLFASLPEVRDTVHPLLDTVVRTGVPYHGNEVAVPVNRYGKREVAFFNFLYHPLKEEDGRVSGVMATAIEVTETVEIRKRIEEGKRLFQAAVSAVQGILWTNSAEGEMEGQQDGWAALTGQTREEYRGYGWLKAVHPDDVGRTVEGWREAVRERGTFILEHRVKTKGGTWRDFSIRAIPLLDAGGTLLNWVGVHTDITDRKQAARALRAHEQKLTIVIEASELGTWEVDVKSGGITASDRFREIMGYRHKDDITLDDTLRSIHPDYIQSREEAFSSAYDKGVFHFTGQVIRGDQSIHWIESKGKVFYDQQGAPATIIGTTADITEQKRRQQVLAEGEQKFRLLADSMPQLIWTTDPEGTLNYYNQSVLDYSGLTAGQIDRGGLIQIVHPDDRGANIQQWENAISAGVDFLFEHRFRRHDGAYRWQLSRAIPQKDENGQIQMWVGTSTDIQQQKSFTQELEAQVGERTKELEVSNSELVRMNQELHSFAYISSHDLQEPLRKIQLFTGRLVKTEGNNLSENGRNMFIRIQSAAQRMQTLIQDLLAYSRTAASEHRLETTDLNRIVTEVKEDLGEELKQSHATVEVSRLCQADLIPFQFRQLMHNLIGNALKFSKPDCAPHIQIKSETAHGREFLNPGLSPRDKYCHITVSDNGIGFDQQYSERIFEVFQRLHGTNEYQGTGIGLAIVKKIVENHKGIITATGEVGKGATFDIYIPST